MNFMSGLSQNRCKRILSCVLAGLLASTCGCAVYSPRHVFDTIALDAGMRGGACPGCSAQQPAACVCYPEPVSYGLQRPRWHAVEPMPLLHDPGWFEMQSGPADSLPHTTPPSGAPATVPARQPSDKYEALEMPNPDGSTFTNSPSAEAAPGSSDSPPLESTQPAPAEPALFEADEAGHDWQSIDAESAEIAWGGSLQDSDDSSEPDGEPLVDITFLSEEAP